MAAYGLYTHIASNKFRSMLLLAGLFVLIYVLVYAGALLAEAVIDSDRSIDDYLMAASRDLVTALAWYVLAAPHLRGEDADQAVQTRRRLSRVMDPADVMRAERRAAQWTPQRWM